jgi:tRNA A-37 threonylcarbamoyl transferase component Bud32
MTGYTTRRLGACVLTTSIGGGMSDEQWRQCCADLFDARGGTVVKQGAYKTILQCTVGGAACLVKVYRTAGLWKHVRSVVAPSRAAREFAAARCLAGAGIPAPRALFMAERRRLGCVTHSLVGIEYLSGARELRDLLFEHHALSSAQRAQVARDFGRLTARLFGCDVFQYDYSLSNIMARRESGGLQLYLIDYERVEPGRAPSPEETLMLLAKLNRVGCEVRLSDRLRFLQGYCGPEAGRPQLHACARDVQRHTIRHLQQDLRRGRLTSLYTHGAYDRISRPGVTGLVRRGYAVADVLSRLPDGGADGAASRPRIAVDRDGRECTLSIVWQPENGASRLWAACSAFRIAGLPLELPHVLIEKAGASMLLVPEHWREHLGRLLARPSRVNAFLKQHFPQAHAALAALCAG